MEVKISVVILSYNLEKYIEECLNSVINQTIFKKLQVVCIDDGSTDRTKEIIKKYTQKYSNIVLKEMKGQEIGIGGLRQIGINMAIGKYLAYIDGDDYIDKYFFEKMYKKIEEEESDIVSCDYYRIEKVKNVYCSSLDKNVVGEIDLSKRKKLILKSGPLWNKLYKLEIIKRNNLKFLEKYAFEDNYFVPIYLMYCKKISQIFEPLYYYRTTNQSSITRKKDNLKFFDRIKTSEELFKKLKEIDKNNFEEKMQEEIEYRFLELYLFNTYSKAVKFKKYPKIYLKEIKEGVKKYTPNYFRNKYYIENFSGRKKIKLRLICRYPYFFHLYYNLFH